MKKTAVVYWSSTGNTEAMAQAVLEGMKEAGAEAVLLTPDAVDVSALVDVLPDLFLCRCVRDPLRDLIRVLADDRTETLPSALAVANMDKGLRLRKQLRVPEYFEAARNARRLLLLGDLLQFSKLCFDLLLGNQILSPQLLQFSSPQAGPAAKFYQFIIVRL